MVILTHCAAGYYDPPQACFNFNEWLPAAAVSASVRSCVPLFFLLAGYLLITEELNAVEFWKRRLSRVIVPWLFWSVIYLWHRRISHGNQISVPSMIRSFVVDDVYYHLWFFYPLIGVYLSIPFLSAFVNHRDTCLMQYALLLWFAATSLFPAIGTFLTEVTGYDCRVAFTFPAVTGFLGVSLAGFLIGNLSISRTRVIAASILLISCVSATFGLSVWEMCATGTPSQKYLSYLRPEVLLAAGAIFYLGRAYFTWDSALLSRLAPLTLGVYLIHPLVLEYLANPLYRWHPSGLAGMPVMFAFVSVVSFSISALIASVPLLRRTVV
jgi:surface polysaccharide O-acyltransferase-like enzyme